MKIKTSKEFFEKYELLSNKIGLDLIIRFLPVKDPDELNKALTLDPNLNTIPLNRWDNLPPEGRLFIKSFNKAPLVKTFTQKSKQSLSHCECVCILKFVATFQIAKAQPDFL